MKAITVIISLVFLIPSFKAIAQDKQINVVDTINCVANDTTVFVGVEKDATFMGGDITKFRDYVSKLIRYPIEAMINNEQGKVYVSFVVDWDGLVKRITILKSSGSKLLDAEAMRVIALSPRWSPAKNNNICVPQQLILPLGFRNLGIINKNQPDLFKNGR